MLAIENGPALGQIQQITSSTESGSPGPADRVAVNGSAKRTGESVLHLPVPAPGELVGTIDSNPKSSPLGAGLGAVAMQFNQDMASARRTGGGNLNGPTGISAHIPGHNDVSHTNAPTTMGARTDQSHLMLAAGGLNLDNEMD